MAYKISKLNKHIKHFRIYLYLLLLLCAAIICVMLLILKFYYKQDKRIGNINLILLTIFSGLVLRMQYYCITMKGGFMCQLPVILLFTIFHIIYTYYIITIVRKKRKKWELYDNYDKIVLGYFIIISIYFSKTYLNLIIHG